MAPNHVGEPLGSMLGPVGSHWVKKKWVKTVKNYHAQKFEISMTPRSSIFSKKWKLWLWRQITVGTPWGPSWGQWGPIGSKKWVKTVKNYHAQKFEFSITPRVIDDLAFIDFSQKMEVTVMAPNHGGEHLGSILGPVGSHWVKKMGQNRKKLPCPKIRIFDYPEVITFSQKMEVTVMAPNDGGDPLGSILGPVGSHWVQKMCQNRKKLPCPKIRIFDYPAVIDFSQKMEVTVMAPNHGGEPLGSILGPMGSHWVQKIGRNRKKLPCPKTQIFHRSSFFRKKWKLRLWRQTTVGTP